MGFTGFLALLFIGLKLLHIIDWSWWLVLLPIYGGFVFIILFGIYVAYLSVRNK